LFLRAYGDRHDDSDIASAEYEFVVIDKNSKHIDMFKEILTWDGVINFPTDRVIVKEDFNPFIKIIESASIKHNVDVGDYLKRSDINSTLGAMMRTKFNNFNEVWNLFRTSKFTFVNIDIIEQNREFCDMLYFLDDLKNLNYKQFIKLDLNKNDYDTAIYTESINNILHLLWIKSFKKYQTVLELADDNNIPFEDYAGKLYVKFNPTFCILPWMHVQYKPNGQSKLCCRYDSVKEYRDYESNLKKNFEI
jgi:hypothetical protein